MKKNDIFNTFYKSLMCRIYILGSPFEGESILFLLYGDNKIIYSCVTDSFKMKGINIPIAIAEICKLDHLTAVFWTHPHDDHSDGLIELINKYKPEYIYIPSNLQTLPDEVSELSKQTLNQINNYHSYDKRYSYHPNVEDIGTNYNILDKELFVSDKKVPFSIYALAPVSGKVRHDVRNNKFNRLNNFSIAISINIGDFSLLLTGDIQDQMIGYILDSFQKDIITPNLLKIPHHGSKDSLKILSLFDPYESIDIAITTAKKASNLPRSQALISYSSRCNRIYKIGDDMETLGIWGVEIDILNATITELNLQNYDLYSAHCTL